MNIFNNFISLNKKSENNKSADNKFAQQFEEIAKLVKEARMQQNLSIKELSLISRIPEQTLNSIENNNKSFIPKYPFIRSILIKLEECLGLKKNSLIKLLIRERETFKKEKKELLLNKFDLINTWQGSILYFFILVLTIFILKRYFVLNVNVIEMQSIENTKIDK